MPTQRLLAVFLAVAVLVPACSLNQIAGPGTPTATGAETPMPAGSAQVEAVRGLLLVKLPSGGGRWLPSTAGSRLPLGSHVRLGAEPGSGARLVFADGHRELLGAGASLSLTPEGAWRIGPGIALPNAGSSATSQGALPSPPPIPKDHWAAALQQALTHDPRLPRLEAQTGADGKRAALEMKALALDVREDSGVAHVTVDMVFTNRADQELEGTFFYAVPEGALITGFEMLNPTGWVKGQVVEREKARQVFEYIKRQQKDPGLLEWAGGNLFKMRVYPIPANGDKRIRLTLAQVLPADTNGNRRFEFPLAGESLRNTPLAQLAVHAASTAGQVMSPSHPLKIDPDRAGGQCLQLEKVAPDRDLVLTFPASTQAQLRTIPAHRAAKGSPFEKEAGSFLLRFKVDADAGRVRTLKSASTQPTRPASASTLIVLLDTTASMGHAPFQTAVAAAKALREMNPDRSIKLALLGQDNPTATTPLALLDFPNPQALDLAIQNRLPIGGNDFIHDLTRLNAALDQAQLPEAQVVYIGDGVPSLGALQTPAQLAAHAAGTLTQGRRLSAIAIGAQADTPFLRLLTKQTHGRSIPLTQAHHAPQAVADLLDATPRLMDVKVRFNGPAHLPALGAIHGATANDLKPTDKLTITGRVPLEWDGQEVELITTGTFDGEPFEHREKRRFDLSADETRADLPRLWAGAHLRHLQDDSTHPAAWRREQIIATSVAYQIPSPLTSYLVLEKEADYARHNIERSTKRVDWRGETLGLKKAVVKMETSGDPQDIFWESANEKPSHPMGLAPELPEGFWSTPILEMLEQSHLEAPALKMLLGGDQWGGIGGASGMFNSGNDENQIHDWIEDNAPTTSPLRGTEGWNEWLDDCSKPDPAFLRPLVDILAKMESPRDRFGIPSFYAKPVSHRDIYVPEDAPHIPRNPWHDSLMVSGVSLNSLPAVSLGLARRAVRAFNGNDAAGARAKWMLLQALSGECASEAQMRAHRREALEIVRSLQPQADNATCRAALRLWESQLTDDSELRHAILWGLLPEASDKAANDPTFFPAGSRLSNGTQTLPAAALTLLSADDDPATRSQAAAIWLKLALRHDANEADYWHQAAEALRPGEAAGRFIETALADASGKTDRLRAALICALRFEGRDGKEKDENTRRVARILDLLLKQDPHAVVHRYGFRGDNPFLVQSAFEKLNRTEEIWAFANRVRQGEEVIQDDEFSTMVDVLKRLDVNRYSGFILACCRSDSESTLSATLTYLAYSGSSDTNEYDMHDILMRRLASGGIPPRLRLRLWREIRGHDRRVYKLDARAILMPVLALPPQHCDLSIQALNLLLPSLAEPELAAWLARLRAAYLQEHPSDGRQPPKLIRELVHAEWMLANMRHQTLADFIQRQWATAADPKDALFIMDACALGANHFWSNWNENQSALVRELTPLLLVFEAKFPRYLAKRDEFGRIPAFFKELLRQDRPDLAEEILHLADPKTPAPQAPQLAVKRVKQHLAANDLSAAAVEALADLKRCESELPALARRLAAAIAELDSALRQYPLPPAPEWERAAEETEESGKKAIDTANRKKWDAHQAAVAVRDKQLQPLVEKADAAASAWNSVDGQRIQWRKFMAALSVQNISVRALWLEQLEHEAAHEDPVRREATTARLRLFDEANEWDLLKAESTRLAEAEPQDIVWAQWRVHACRRAGDQAGLRSAVGEWEKLDPFAPTVETLPDEDPTPQEEASALWHALTQGDGDADSTERRLMALLPLEACQTAIAKDLRAWKRGDKMDAETEASILLLQAKLAQLENRPEDRRQRLLQASQCRSRQSEGKIAQALLNAGMLDAAADYAMRLIQRPRYWNQSQAVELVSRSVAGTSHELRLLEARFSENHWDDYVLFANRTRLIELLCAANRFKDADLQAAAWFRDAHRPMTGVNSHADLSGRWRSMSRIAKILRAKGQAVNLAAWVAQERPMLLQAVAHWLKTGAEEPIETRQWFHAMRVYGDLNTPIEPMLIEAESSNDPGRMLRAGKMRKIIWEDTHVQGDDGSSRSWNANEEEAYMATSIKNYGIVSAHPQATAEQKTEAWKVLLGRMKTWDEKLRIYDHLDALIPATADQRMLHRLEALWHLKRHAEADAIAEKWLGQGPAATPEKRKAMALILAKAKQYGIEGIAPDVAWQTLQHQQELIGSATQCHAYAWAARATRSTLDIQRAMGEKIPPEKISRHYQTLANAHWQADRPADAAQAICDGLAAYAPATLREGDDLSGANHELTPAYWGFSYQRLLGFDNDGGNTLRKRLDQVETHYLTHILPAKGDHPNVRLGLALAFDDLGQTARAIPHWQAMVTLAPAEGVWRKKLIQSLLDAKQYQEAVKACQVWLAFDPRARQAHPLLASALAQGGKPDQALAALAGGADAQPMEAHGHTAYAEALVKHKHTPAAIEELSRAIAVRPTAFAPVNAYADLLATEPPSGSGDPRSRAQALYANGLAACDKAIADLPEDPQPHLEKIRFLRALARENEAHDLSQWIRNHPWPRFQWETHREAEKIMNEP